MRALREEKQTTAAGFAVAIGILDILIFIAVIAADLGKT